VKNLVSNFAFECNLYRYTEGGGGAEVVGGEAGDGEVALVGVGYTDDLEFRVVRSQGHIRPGLQLGIPFDMYNRAPDGALASFVEQQRKRQEEAEFAALATAE
jgi:hypothetical protein